MNKKVMSIISLMSVVCYCGVVFSLMGKEYIQVLGECNHNGFHYDHKNPTSSTYGYQEFWSCCKCGEKFLEKPSHGNFVDSNSPDFAGQENSHPAIIRKLGETNIKTQYKSEKEMNENLSNDWSFVTPNYSQIYTNASFWAAGQGFYDSDNLGYLCLYSKANETITATYNVKDEDIKSSNVLSFTFYLNKDRIVGDLVLKIKGVDTNDKETELFNKLYYHVNADEKCSEEIDITKITGEKYNLFKNIIFEVNSNGISDYKHRCILLKDIKLSYLEGGLISKKSVHENIDNVRDTETVLLKYTGGKWTNLLPLNVVINSSDPKWKMQTVAERYPFRPFKNYIESLGLSIVNGTFKYSDWITESEFNLIYNSNCFSKYNVEIDHSIDGTRGYTITTVGNSIFIYADSRDGYQLATTKLMEIMFGQNIMRNNFAVYNKMENPFEGKEIKIPDFHIKEIPDIKIRLNPTSTFNSTTKYSYEEFGYVIDQYFKCSSQRINSGLHNSLDYLPTSTYLSSHPKWYNDSQNELCLTAHGDSGEYSLLVDEMANVFKDELIDSYRSNLLSRRLCLSLGDGLKHCICDSCKTMATYYGAESGAMIRFLNDVAKKFYEFDEVKANISEKGEARLGFLAYQYMCQPPTRNLSEIKMDDRISVYIAPSRVGTISENDSVTDWTSPFTDSNTTKNNQSAYRYIKSWSKLCTDIGLYGYVSNYSNYLCPFDSFEASVQNFKDYYNLKCDWIYNTCGYFGDAVSLPAFANFKVYLESKLMIDTSLTLQELENMFFEDNYGDASDVMYSMYTSVINKLKEKRKDGTITGYINQFSGNPSGFKDIFSFNDLISFCNQIDNAYALVESDNLKLSIASDGMFAHFFLLNYYSNQLSASQTTKYRNLLKEESNLTKISIYRETSPNTFTSLFSWWND